MDGVVVPLVVPGRDTVDGRVFLQQELGLAEVAEEIHSHVQILLDDDGVVRTLPQEGDRETGARFPGKWPIETLEPGSREKGLLKALEPGLQALGLWGQVLGKNEADEGGVRGAYRVHIEDGSETRLVMLRNATILLTLGFVLDKSHDSHMTTTILCSK